MKLTTAQISSVRFHRRSGKGYKKLLTNHSKSLNGYKKEPVRELSPCDNSNDSGLGIENSTEYLRNSNASPQSVLRFPGTQKRALDESFNVATNAAKRHRPDLKTQNDLQDSSTYSFPVPSVTLPNSNSICVTPSNIPLSVPMASKSIRRSIVSGKRLVGPVTLSTQLSSTSRNGKIQLQIIHQPEQQHRARYQTEGSRGAVKDRSGNNFPVVKVVGYNKLTTLQVFIGSDQGRVTPHMFYQACRVTGKNSTPCSEKNINGTIVIEIDMDPAKDMTVMCDCVGILKERNVDVEHRFPEECSTRSKKKSTRCRMVFRTQITHDDGTIETLQAASQPIACTQPPGVPEICKKSLTSCPASGGKELFILGKNFLKDTHILFVTDEWRQTVNPDKEFLQQTHLVCTVPSYKNVDISESVNAKIKIISGGRTSEPHTFTYTPVRDISSPVPVAGTSSIVNNSNCLTSDCGEVIANVDSESGLKVTKDSLIKTSSSSIDNCKNNVHSGILWPSNAQNMPSDLLSQQHDVNMMPPPAILPRRPSVQLMIPDTLASVAIKNDPCSTVTSSEAILTTSYIDTPFTPVATTTMSNMSVISPPYGNGYADALKQEPLVVPKVEPLSDNVAVANAMSCAVAAAAATADSYSPTNETVASGTTCVGSSIKNGSTAANMYSNTSSGGSSFMLDMYPTAVTTKNEPCTSPVQEALSSPFTINKTPSPNMLTPANTPSSFIDGSLSLNAALCEVDDSIRDKISDMMREQQLTAASCTLKSSTPGYDNLCPTTSSFCYKTAQPSSAAGAAVDYHQNYVMPTLDTPPSTIADTVSTPNLLLENSNLPLINNMMQPRKNTYNPTKAATTFLNSSLALPTPGSATTAPSSDTMLNNFVPSGIVDNLGPKLDELVNSAAESHIRAAAAAATVNNAAATSILDTFLGEPPRNDVLNNVMPDIATTTTASNEPDALVVNSLLGVPCGSGNGTGAMVNGLSMVGSSTAAMDKHHLDLIAAEKETAVKTTTANTSSGNAGAGIITQLVKKNESNFQSDFSCMSENELLSYINPVCFEEVYLERRTS